MKGFHTALPVVLLATAGVSATTATGRDELVSQVLTGMEGGWAVAEIERVMVETMEGGKILEKRGVLDAARRVGQAVGNTADKVFGDKKDGEKNDNRKDDDNKKDDNKTGGNKKKDDDQKADDGKGSWARIYWERSGSTVQITGQGRTGIVGRSPAGLVHGL